MISTSDEDRSRPSVSPIRHNFRPTTKLNESPNAIYSDLTPGPVDVKMFYNEEDLTSKKNRGLEHTES